MAWYIAWLRGIGPSNPNMRNENLRRVCESLGFDRVQTVISSGNVIFESDITDTRELETMLEESWPKQLGFKSTTIVRTRADLEDLVEMDPFEGLEHGRDTYLLVTFAKDPIEAGFEVPFEVPDQACEVVAVTDRELFTVTDTTADSSVNVMAWLEKEFGKEISSRTWLTVHRVLKRVTP